MKEELIQFALEIQNMLNSGKNLKEISQWSYQERESGRNIPYLSILNKSSDGKIILDLAGNPISTQKELKKFWDEKVEGSVLPKYKLFVNNEIGVEFTERFGKGDNIISLI